ncbi:MAG: hypothetical protein LBS34_00265 [Rickettsiales bacterium]|jgi:hypothetical protein|nr:hypothetical protein [Rickettsiales bacterium]
MTNKKNNLKPIKKGELTKEEAKRRGKNGAKKSAEVRREKRNFQQACRWFLGTGSEDGLTNLEMIVLKQGEKALNGELQAAVFMRDTAGEKPMDRIEQTNIDMKPLKIEIVE